MIQTTPAPVAEVEGVRAASKFEIAADRHQHIMQMLADKTYNDKIGAVVREYVLNAVDSHRAAKQTRKIDVIFPTTLAPEFRVRDYGVGLSESEAYEMLRCYGSSTKRDSNDLIGCLGIGSKSGFAYADMFSIICRKNGIETVISNYRDGKKLCFDVVATQATDEPNGVEVVIPASANDASDFVEAARKYLFCVADELNFNLEVDMPKPVWVNDRYGYLTNFHGGDIVVLVNAPLRANHHNQSFTLLMRGLPDEVDFAMNRETVEYTDRTKKFLEEHTQSGIDCVKRYLAEQAVKLMDADAVLHLLAEQQVDSAELRLALNIMSVNRIHHLLGTDYKDSALTNKVCSMAAEFVEAHKTLFDAPDACIKVLQEKNLNDFYDVRRRLQDVAILYFHKKIGRQGENIIVMHGDDAYRANQRFISGMHKRTFGNIGYSVFVATTNAPLGVQIDAIRNIVAKSDAGTKILTYDELSLLNKQAIAEKRRLTRLNAPKRASAKPLAMSIEVDTHGSHSISKISDYSADDFDCYAVVDAQWFALNIGGDVLRNKVSSLINSNPLLRSISKCGESVRVLMVRARDERKIRNEFDAMNIADFIKNRAERIISKKHLLHLCVDGCLDKARSFSTDTLRVIAENVEMSDADAHNIKRVLHQRDYHAANNIKPVLLAYRSDYQGLFDAAGVTYDAARFLPHTLSEDNLTLIISKHLGMPRHLLPQLNQSHPELLRYAILGKILDTPNKTV